MTHESQSVVARDSGFGDDYFYHLECDALLAPEGDFELVAATGIPLSRRYCIHCRYELEVKARPVNPRVVE